jgi:hypothetical protein
MHNVRLQDAENAADPGDVSKHRRPFRDEAKR